METDKSKELHAHGMTRGDLEKIRMNTIHDTVAMIPANNVDTITDKHFKEDFKDGFMIPDHEKQFYHIVIESRTFDSTSGERLSTPRVQIYDTTVFEQMNKMKPHSGFHGLTTHILHNPTKVSVSKGKSEPANTGSGNTGASAEYAHLTDTKLAKAKYKMVTGNDAARTWNLQKTIEAIVKFKAENPK